MMDMGYPLHLIDLLAKLYSKQLAKVKVTGTLSEWFSVKERSPTSLCPFSILVQHPILAEIVIRETLNGFQGGLQIGLIQNEQLEQVNMFPYLGSLITEDGECMTEFHKGNQGITEENMESHSKGCLHLWVCWSVAVIRMLFRHFCRF